MFAIVPRVIRCAFGALAVLCSASPGQVTINEVSSVQSDRLLQFPPGGLPTLGATPAWHAREFAVPSWWNTGVGPIGFGSSQTTNVQGAMLGKTPALYLRREFTVTAGQAANTNALELLINYADGFVAYINGQEVARRNSGAMGSYAWHNQPAFHSHPPGTVETVALGAANTRLTTGTNVLAIQILNNDVDEGILFCSATLRIGGASPTNLVVPADAWSHFAGVIPPSGGLYDAADFGASYPAGPDWTHPSYLDTTWSTGAGALGYDTAADYDAQLGTELTAQMQGITPSVYMRRAFALSQGEFDALTTTTLTVDWDDGYVLYLNGYELSRSNVPGAPGSFVAYNQSASDHPASRDNAGNNPAAVVAVTVPKNLLRVGQNVISAQLHNAGSGSSDLLLDIRFSGVSGGNPLVFVGLGSAWRYRIGLQEFANPPAAVTTTVLPEFLDWIELRNAGAAAVDLSGWSLTDDSDEPALWQFPAGTSISAGGFLVVACSGRDIKAPTPGGLLHTNFSLNSNGEYLALRNAGGVLQSELAGVPDQDAFHTWGRDSGSGQYRFLDRGTPGAENFAGTANAATAEVDFDKATGFHNAGFSVALSTTTPGATIRYTTDGSDPTESNGTAYTTPFDPTSQPGPGPGTGTILREMFQWSSGTFVTPPNLPANATPTSTSLLSQLETSSNISDYYTHRVRGYVYAPATGSYDFYLATDDDGELWLSTDENPANKQRIAYIQANWTSPREWTRHTTQRSAPRALVAGQRYYIEVLQSEGSGGDNLAVGWSGPGLPGGINVIEGRYLAPPAVLPPGTQPPPGYATVRARAFVPGRLPSEIRTRNYVVGAHPNFSTVPAIFLSGPASQTFYAPNGCFSAVGGQWSNGSWQPGNIATDYNFALMRGDAFERPAAIEFIGPGNTVVERTNVGARFAGSPWSRPQYRLDGIATSGWNTDWLTKPQMNIFFRGGIGISKLEIPGFIPGSKVNEWDELRFRAGKNDAYDPFIIDEFMRRTFNGTGAAAPLGYFASLFINGQFKSYFNVTERPRKNYFQEFHGGNNDWDVHYNYEWEDGDGAAYSTMENYFRNNDFTTLANYQLGAAYWDMINVADYFIVNGWGATQDWPHNNFIFARERAPGALWRFSMWDAEGAFGTFGQSNTHNSFDSELLVPEGGGRNPTMSSDGTMTRLVFRRAYQNAEFRLLFADRLQKHFYNGGTMTRPNLQARWDSLRTQANPLIRAVFNRDGTNYHWTNWANRDATFLNQCRAIGLWPATLAPNFSVGPSSVSLTNPNVGGTIYYTINGTDPRGTGGTTQGTNYATPIPISAPFALKARVRSGGGEWSPLLETTVAPPPPKVVFSEIHYNPPGPDDTTEFLELTNVGGTPASLNGAHFTSGIEFSFANVSLGVGQSLVLVKDPIAFAAAYPGVPIAGVFGGALSNDTDTLTLVDITEDVICSITYYDSNVAGWPTAADGDGSTLILKRPFSAGTNPSLAASWRSSGTPGGKPGTVDSTVFAGNPMADIDQDGFFALVEYAFGTSDTNGNSRPSYTLTRDANGRLSASILRSEAADDVTIEAMESSDLGTWTLASADGETTGGAGWMRSFWLSNASGNAVFVKFRVRLE